MTYVDAALLNIVERACHRFQRLTGRTNVWLAFQLTNLSIIVYFVWAILSFWRGDVMTRVGLGLFCSGLLFILYFLFLRRRRKDGGEDDDQLAWSGPTAS